MSIEHKNLTGTDLHEPKGAAAAAVGQTYVANGAGSGVWKSPLSTLNDANKIFLTINIPALNAGGSIFTVSPLAGKVVGLAVVLNGSITTANDTVSLKINGIAVTGSTATIIYTGSVAGAVYTASPSSSNVFTANGAIEVVNSGTSAGAVSATVVLTIDVS